MTLQIIVPIFGDVACLFRCIPYRLFKDQEKCLKIRNTPKVGSPIMLLKNLYPSELCDGTRTRVIVFQTNLIEAKIITQSAKGESVCIPRVLTIPSDYPFTFERVQFLFKCVLL